MWDLPRPGLEPVSLALAGRFLTTAPPGKPLFTFLNSFFFSNQNPKEANHLISLICLLNLFSTLGCLPFFYFSFYMLKEWSHLSYSFPIQHLADCITQMPLYMGWEAYRLWNHTALGGNLTLKFTCGQLVANF